MYRRDIHLIFFIMALLLLQPGSTNALREHNPIDNPSPNAYIPGNDIWIVNEQDIINYGFPGNGTKNNPYLIDGYTIDTSLYGAAPITIKYTSVYIRVSNNTLISTGSNRAGILLHNTTNVEIINNDISIAETSSYLDAYAIGIFGNSYNNIIANNYIHDGDDGIVIHGISGDTFAPYSNYVYNNTFIDLILRGVWLGGASSNTIMRDNSIVSNNFTRVSTGVKIDAGTGTNINRGNNDLEIKNNRFLGNNYGINIAGSGTEATFPAINKNITIANNTIIASWNAGIYISRHHYNNIINNTIIDGQDVGLQLRDTDYNNVTGNIIFNNAKHGIWLDGALSRYNNINNNIIANTSSLNNFGIYDPSGNFNQFSFNTIANNTGYGVYFISANNNNVSSNDFINNNPSGTVQVFAQFIDNSIFEYNYWSDWTTPDVDGNGIVDQPYIIYASAKVQDPFPMVNPYSSGVTVVPHSLSGLKVLSPNGGETLTGTVNISWDPAVDTKSHNITYSVYYFDGVSWVSMVNNTSTSSFMWDTTQVTNGSTYMIKVVASDGNGLSIEDISDSSFTIDNPPPHIFSGLQVLSPNGGETLKGMANITWNLARDSRGHSIIYSVYYSSDAISWNFLGNSTTSSYLWNTSSVVNGTYFVKVIAFDGNGLSIEDISDGSFKIDNLSPHTFTGLQILFPNGREVLEGIVNIIWNPAIDSRGHSIIYSVFYSSDFISWNFLGNSTTSSYVWNTSSVVNGTYSVKVVAFDGNGLSIVDYSDDSFTIANPITTSTTTSSTSTSTSTTTSTSTSTTTDTSTSTSSSTPNTSSSSTASTPLNLNYIVISILGLSLINIKKKKNHDE